MKKGGDKTNVILLGLTSFFNDIGSEMILPILPLFLLSFGAGGLAIGLVGGFREGLASIIKLYFGYASDKKGKRKPYVLWGYFSSSLSKIFLLFSKAWPQVLIFTSFDRFGKGMRDSPRDVIVSESMKNHRGEGFGIHRTLDTLGAVVGSILVLLLFWHYQMKFNSIILLAGVISMISLIPLFFVKDIKTKGNNHFDFKKIKISKQEKLFLLASAIFALANFSYMFFVLRAKDAFPGKYEILIPIALYVVFNIVYAICAYPMGKIADKSGKKSVLFVGYILFIVVNIGFLISSSVYAYIALFIIYGLVFAMIQGNQIAFISELADEKYRGTTLGIFYAIIGIMAILSGLIIGLMWDVSKSSIFIFSAILSLISAVIILRIKSNK